MKLRDRNSHRRQERRAQALKRFRIMTEAEYTQSRMRRGRTNDIEGDDYAAYVQRKQIEQAALTA